MISIFVKNLALSALIIAILSSCSHANGNPEDQRSQSEDDEGQTGFVESINFNDFFEDVGLHGAHSEPAVARRPYSVTQEERSDGATTDGFGDDGYMPSDPMAGFEASPSNLYEITSDQDFYASESSPFDDFYGFDDHSEHGRSHPYAASRHRRIYSSPSEHRPFTSEDFRDFGPPKGFFNDEFDGELKKSQSAQQEEQKKQLEEKEDPSKKKCETVVKSGMTCEVCNDGYGGFSEHCSHRLNSGKDQKYANSRRNAKDGVYKPHGPDEGFHPDETEEHEDTSRKQASNPEPENYPEQRPAKRKQRPQQVESYDDESSSSDKATAYDNRRRNEPKQQVRRHHNVSPVSTPRQDKKSDDAYVETTADKVYAPKKKNRDNRQFGKDAFYDPYPDHSHYHPYYFGDVAEIDRPVVPDYGLGDHGHDLQAAANQAARNKKRIKTLGDEHDHYSSSSAKVHLKPIDAEANFKVLNKMMKKFSKKDRKNCEKRTTKKGMTCYVCPNKHGQVDEECMYENDDPSKGVHMMYKEESSY